MAFACLDGLRKTMEVRLASLQAGIRICNLLAMLQEAILLPCDNPSTH
jgi:hypothetical protein